MQYSYSSVDGVPIVARFDESKSGRFGCINCLRQRLKRYINVFGDNTETPVPIEQLIQHLENLPNGLQLAISGIPGDNAVAIMPFGGCQTCRKHHRSDTENNQYVSSYGLVVENMPGNNGFRYRELPPESFSNRVSPFFGVLGIAGIPVMQKASIRDMHFVNCIQFLDQSLQYDVAGGKGNDKDACLASCMGEAIERYYLSGICSTQLVRAAYEDISTIAVNPEVTWGFPVNDSHVVEYTSSSQIQWTKVESIASGNEYVVPADMIYSPPLADSDAVNVTAGSTNGTSAGANLNDATIQSVLELIERDSYWYYFRSRTKPVSLDAFRVCSSRILKIMNDNTKLHYTFELMPNPFRVPVVQVLVEDESTGITARGTGAMFTLDGALDRAFNESNQMLVSLQTGIDVAESLYHMRSIWYHGKAKQCFANIFNPASIGEVDDLYDAVDKNRPLDDLVSRLNRFGIDIYRKILIDSSLFCVTKCLASRIGTHDATYYKRSTRLEEFADQMNYRYEPSPYVGTLFM